MAGLYFHIPFCANRCIYCGFYSTTRLDMRDRYVDAMCRELVLRQHYLAGAEAALPTNESQPCIDSIYFGGGTPSQLTPGQIDRLFRTIADIFFRGNQETIREHCEVTLECNPDDLTPDFIDVIKVMPVNRISMGAQTFSDKRLKSLHRRHTASEVYRAVTLLRKAGIGNISIDLMFGFPDETLDEWTKDIDEALDLQVEHISAYSLMYEEGTVLRQLLRKKKIREIDEELSLAMYQTLVDRLKAAGYEHYEISNFAKFGFRSRHNSSYWRAIPYLGIGASAHSYDIGSRQWNVADLGQYATAVERGEIPCKYESLDEDTRYNDLVVTALRTSEGIALSRLKPKYRNYLMAQAEKQIARNLIEIQGDYLRLTSQGLYISDAIMSNLIYI